VDEKGRGAVDAAGDTAPEVFPHSGLVHAPPELFPKACDIETQVARVFDEILAVQRELPLEQAVVHLPELALRSRSFGGLRRVLRVGVALAQREVAVHESQSATHPLLDRFDDGVRAPAVRALVVAVLDQRNRRICRTLDVVALPHGQRQRCRRIAPGHAWVRSPATAARARRMPSAPGLTPTGET